MKICKLAFVIISFVLQRIVRKLHLKKVFRNDQFLFRLFFIMQQTERSVSETLLNYISTNPLLLALCSVSQHMHLLQYRCCLSLSYILDFNRCSSLSSDILFKCGCNLWFIRLLWCGDVCRNRNMWWIALYNIDNSFRPTDVYMPR